MEMQEENPQKYFSQFFYRFYGETEARLRQIFTEAAQR